MFGGGLWWFAVVYLVYGGLHCSSGPTTNPIAGFVDVHSDETLKSGYLTSDTCFCCSQYDILLVTPTVSGLQTLLNVCEEELRDLDMRLNVSKSVCMRFGSRYDIKCADIISSQGGELQWVDSCRYLGVYFTSGRLFKCCFHNAKCKFFRAFNSIFSKVGGFASEEVVLSLLRSKCLPCLLYGVEACPFVKRDKHSFDFSLTRLFMKLFRTGSPTVVAECQMQFNFLPLRYQIDYRTARFLFDYSRSSNSICMLYASPAITSLNAIFESCSVTSLFNLKSALNESFVSSQ